MQRIKKVQAAVLTVTLAAALAATAAPAVAQDSSVASTLTLFEGENFTGDSFAPESGTCVNLTDHGWGDGRVNSAINSGSNSAVLFMNEDCVGDPFQVAPNSSRASLGTFSPNSVLVQG